MRSAAMESNLEKKVRIHRIMREIAQADGRSYPLTLDEELLPRQVNVGVLDRRDVYEYVMPDGSSITEKELRLRPIETLIIPELLAQEEQRYDFS